MVQPVQTRIRAADYYQLPEYIQNSLIQLIDGEVIVAMPPIIKHQVLVGEIFFLLMTIARRVGGRAFTAPTEVYLDEHNLYEPDVLYLAPETTCVAEEKRLVGAPDLVVEVLSPGTAKHDREQKYRAYERHSVREYWIVDPAHDVLEVWVLSEGAFKRLGAYAAGDSFESPILGETIHVGALFSA
jgi:Uma2 family endonuclease